ncbi:MAG: heavy metal-binding domain-containing protein [Balneola sp.]
MIMSTTNNLDGREVKKYLGIVTGETILGVNIFKDISAGIRNIVGGRSASYEGKLQDARRLAFGELEDKASRVGANAIIGIDIDYETIGANGSMLMVSVSGTAVLAE